MRAELNEYLAYVEGPESADGDSLEAAWQEARRSLSPRGLDRFLLGIRSMHSLGKGRVLVLAYLREIPAVAKEVGEDVIPDIIEALMKLSSLTSGRVLCLVLANLPLAAARLGDAELLRGYLSLLRQLAGRAPRGLRPMLENLGELLSKLTLGGLRRWALWGAEAYARDFDGQQAYFGLRNETARSVLRRERRGTLFVDHHRKLNFYLRALWGRAFPMRPTSGDHEDRRGRRPAIEGLRILLPDAFDARGEIAGLDAYRAAAAHAAAHLVYTREPVAREPVSETQRCFVNLFEDARVEYLAWRRFPGLRRLWLRFFEQAHGDDGDGHHPAIAIMLALGRGLLDDDYRCRTAELGALVEDFRRARAGDPRQPSLALDYGLRAHRLVAGRMTLPAPRILEDWPIAYRDDNVYSWRCDPEGSGVVGDEAAIWLRPTLRRRVTLMEMVNEIDSELVDESPQEIWVLPSELFPYEDQGKSYNELEGKEPLAEPCHYEEWDYQVQLSRPDWTTVVERRQPAGDPAVMDAVLQRHRPIASRVRHLVDALQPRGIVRQRHYEDGDELDIDAAVRAMIDLRRGVTPDPRVNIRVTRIRRDLAMLVLLDLSQSTNDRIGPLREGEEGYLDQPRVLDLTRDATGLLAWAVDAIGDRFAIHGFASEGRHDVRYYRFKHFDEAYAEAVRSRLAGMRGSLSTRMGAALRHAGRHLEGQPASKRLILLITDGEPADIDERDPRYLRQDTKQAVESLAARGIHTHCLTLDPDADAYVSSIFGANRYSVVDRIERLPERLPGIFSALTR